MNADVSIAYDIAWLDASVGFMDRLVDLLELDLAVQTSTNCDNVLGWTYDDLQDEVRVGWDEATTDRLAAVGKIARDVERSLLAELHLNDALVPTC